MKNSDLNVNCKGVDSSYPISVGNYLLEKSGEWAKQCLTSGTKKIAIVSNPTVFRLYGNVVFENLNAAGFEVVKWLMEDGEQHKNMLSAEAALRFFSDAGLTRTDAVAALGGGVVGDLAGFTASIYLRGVQYLQMPTTLLSMIDSSVGGKTGVNSDGGKNTIGAFYHPRGVLVDSSTLQTLHRREVTAGFCEAIKLGAVADDRLLDQVSGFLSEFDVSRFSTFFENGRFQVVLNELIFEQIRFKASVVEGDERESTDREDVRSRKILNFGHTLAHSLEKVTDYKYFRHGEAVGYGVLYAAELSKILALLDDKVVKLLNDVVHRAGKLPSVNNLDPKLILEAFRFDKKKASGKLQMVLLEGIGKPVIVCSEDIPHTSQIQALTSILQKTDNS